MAILLLLLETLASLTYDTFILYLSLVVRFDGIVQLNGDDFVEADIVDTAEFERIS